MPNQWIPISEAPKDGAEVDLWMVDEDGKGWRETNAYWVDDRDEVYYSYNESGDSVQRCRRRSGWYSYSHEDGGFIDTPRHFNPHPRQQREIFTEATHFMFLPDPPNAD